MQDAPELHTQLASRSRKTQLSAKRRLHSFDKLVIQELEARQSVQSRQSLVHRLLLVGEKHGRFTSGLYPGRLEGFPRGEIQVTVKNRTTFSRYMTRASFSRMLQTLRLRRLSMCFGVDNTYFQYCLAFGGRPRISLYRSRYPSSTAGAASFRRWWYRVWMAAQLARRICFRRRRRDTIFQDKEEDPLAVTLWGWGCSDLPGGH
ncbi:hypothetical protein T265_06574 [Opisthorchis viverrini]|uniref:Uncharacterized protein n=1 Tax=Opisthorchis viverrini TaxID=6198 RepID=A0A075ADJ5_OPIVI|nr:hypothetical protein T265_06574 [Opisthorchis viverrini]KER26094.1 hypothetical protein T265_06574 [Opisthorchis viverrini]